MSRFSDDIRDELGRAIPGVLVYVYEWDVPSQTTGALSALTDDDLTTALPNPLTSDEFGEFYFNASDGVKLLEYHYGGKLQYRAQIILTPAGFYPGNDATLRADLAASGGAALIANSGGGTIQDAVFVKGNAVAVGGGNAEVDWQRQDAAAPVAGYGALWANPVVFNHAISKAFSAGASLAGTPAVTFFTAGKNTGNDGDVVGHMSVGEVAATGKTAFGANFIAFSSGGVNNYKLVGLEIDVQPQVGTTPTSIGGLVINAFTMTAPGPAIYFDGIFGGKWSTGINVGNLSDSGAGIAPATGNPRMGTLLDSGTAQYQIGAIKLNNTHGIVHYNAAGSGMAAKRYCDASNVLRDVIQPGGLLFRDAADANTYASVSSTGVLVVSGGVGYAAGAGGTVTQATSKSTGVTLNKACGAITMNAAALAANTIVSFTLTNSSIAADDDVRVWVKSGNASVGSYRVATEGSAAGSRTIVVENKTAGSLSEAVVLGFNVIKAVAA